MNASAASSSPSGAIIAVVAFCLTMSGVCLAASIIWGILEYRLLNAQRASKPAVGRPVTPVQEQAGTVDLSGLAKLAGALEKLTLSGRLLVVSLGFALIAAVAAGTGSIASAVS